MPDQQKCKLVSGPDGPVEKKREKQAVVSLLQEFAGSRNKYMFQVTGLNQKVIVK